jgi:Ca2+-binding RTX toxin-like protein
VPIPGALIPPFVQEQQQSFQFANGNIVQIFSTESSQDGKDKIHGNDGDDVVIGGGADDNIYGEEGADAILGDAGIVDFSKGKITQIASSLPTVSGNDTLDLGDDADIGIGGSGEDTIVGGTDTADDILLGDNGTVVRNDGTAQANDIFSTFPDNGGRDNLIGGAGNDIMIGGTAAEDIKGGTGNDIILGDHGTVNRGATDTVEQITTTFEDQGANDTIDGEAGADIALGGFGDDLISGGSDAANDILLGDNGTVVRNDGSADANDIFSQSPTLGGLDTISGGAGEDTIVGGTGGDQLSGEGDRDVVIGDHARINRNSADQIESVLTTFADLGGDDQVNGNQGDDILIGGVGKDTVDGATGDDIAQGDNGFLDYSVDGNLNTLDQVSTSNPTQGDRDTLIGAEGNDLLMGGTLSDWIDAGSGNDLVFGDHGRVQGTILLNALPLNQVTPPFTFTAIDTQLADLGGSETIQGGTGDDIILGQQGDDVLEGNDGDDDLIGGHNVAGGADGSDVIDGGVGQDAIAGDNASILRQADVQSPRIRVLSGTVIYDANGNPPITAAGQANPTGASARNIQVFDQSTTPTPGTFGNDNLAGGANDDLIFGQLGEDTVQGDSATSTPVSATIPSTAANTDGDDYIEGGGGNDLLFGNLGQDDMIGGSSSLFGGAAQRPDGSDTIFGGAGSAIVRNSLGDTTAAGHAKDADVIIGDNGNIFRLVGINGVSQNSYLKFNYDNYSPTIKIIPRAVQLLDYTPVGSNALGGDDLIRGEAGDDILYGMTGNDVAFGDGQDDNLFGGTGSDRLYGGTGEDGILGDDGLLLTSRNGLSEPLHGVTPPNQQTSISIPGPFIGAEIFLNGRLYKMADLLVPNSGGNDVIYGGLGDDFLHGGAGDDGISGAEALPSFYNANPVSNTNPLGYDPLTRKLAAYDANTPFTKVQGFFLNFDATTTGGAKLEDGKDYVFGDIGNDWLVGGTGKDRLFGGFGDDLLNGDDNHETNGGLNNRTDPAPFTDGDFAFGGAGLDVLIANTGGDRLFDWIGEFNSYFVPFSAFGYPTVNRSPSPHIQQFLLNLGRSAGADQTLTEPNGELGLVTQQDPQWQDQNGPPRDPQAGNLPGGGRDTRGAPENDAVGSGTPSLGTVFLSSDPSQPTRQALFVRGGDAADQIEIRRGSTASLIRVLINGVSQGEFNQSQVGRIIVYGGGGNDNISIFNDIGAIATLIYGEEGNDILRGGLSTNFIDGGSGNDTLSGNTGRDIIIGGLGQDQINGSSGDDILIGGSYLYAQDPVAIDSLIAAWGQALLYSQRVANLKLASNWFAFNNLTLTDDSVTDTLTGAQAQDWFLTTIADITDKKNNEVIN